MGLTKKSTGSSVNNDLIINRVNGEKVIALAGNPNVGKSTVFNELTGLNQHTGNWPGKTVSNAQGKYSFDSKEFILVDIPGTYSLMASSVEEEVARDFICFGNPDTTVIVCDATCLERNLNLVLQILEITNNAVICVNLLDEAKKKKITIDLDELSLQLGVPIIGTSARAKKGLVELQKAIFDVTYSIQKTYNIKLTYDERIENVLSKLTPIVEKAVDKKLNARWISIKLLDLDETLHKSLTDYLGIDLLENEEICHALEQAHISLLNNGIETEEIRDVVVSNIVNRAEHIAKYCVNFENACYNIRDRKLDKLLTSKATGIPIMILLLAIIFWITITGANYPSQLLSYLFFGLQEKLTGLFIMWGTPSWVEGLLIQGMYRTVAWVVSVMLPPMAIFFPLFTLLEDLGYLPRIAFNMDNFFRKANAHGKQSLTMCMGFGCNACGVIGCRIIDSPRERLIAILTNNFVPCNGRFPTLIAIITMFFAGVVVSNTLQSVISTIFLIAIILLGVFTTLFISKLLSSTILKGVPSSFMLELPPFRTPQFGKVIVRSIFDRTLFVLGRAVCVALPAGLVIWIMSNLKIYDVSILRYCADFLDPFAKFIGLDGVILLAFILGFPANEIVFPIIIMAYLSTGSLIKLDNLSELKSLLVNNGWTWVTAICTMLFSLMHFPCSTTCLTIKKETKSLKWTALAFIIPTIIGIILCGAVNNIAKLII